MSRRLLLLSLLTSTLLGAQVLQANTEPAEAGNVISAGMAPAIGYWAARSINKDSDGLASALSSGGGALGAMGVKAILNGIRIGGSTARCFGIVGMLIGASVGGL